MHFHETNRAHVDERQAGVVDSETLWQNKISQRTDPCEYIVGQIIPVPTISQFLPKAVAHAPMVCYIDHVCHNTMKTFLIDSCITKFKPLIKSVLSSIRKNLIDAGYNMLWNAIQAILADQAPWLVPKPDPTPLFQRAPKKCSTRKKFCKCNQKRCKCENNSCDGVSKKEGLNCNQIMNKYGVKCCPVCKFSRFIARDEVEVHEKDDTKCVKEYINAFISENEKYSTRDDWPSRRDSAIMIIKALPILQLVSRSTIAGVGVLEWLVSYISKTVDEAFHTHFGCQMEQTTQLPSRRR
jgi:hypothetical protein